MTSEAMHGTSILPVIIIRHGYKHIRISVVILTWSYHLKMFDSISTLFCGA